MQWDMKQGGDPLPARVIYEKMLPDIISELVDPKIPYWPGSPYGGKGWDTADPTVGDVVSQPPYLLAFPSPHDSAHVVTASKLIISTNGTFGPARNTAITTGTASAGALSPSLASPVSLTAGPSTTGSTAIPLKPILSPSSCSSTTRPEALSGGSRG